jgi:hypothetical protein
LETNLLTTTIQQHEIFTPHHTIKSSSTPTVISKSLPKWPTSFSRTRSTRDRIRRHLVFGLHRIWLDLAGLMEVSDCFREMWDEEDWARFGVREWMVDAISAAVDVLWGRYENGKNS